MTIFFILTFFSSSSFATVVCEIGKVGIESTQNQDRDDVSDCKACVVGQYSTDPSQPGCLACAAGMFKNDATVVECSNCPQGRFNEREGSDNINACMECSMGKYQPAAGSVACINCPGGKANGETASTSDAVCIDCLPGKHTNDQTGIDKCLDCAAGTHSNDPGQATCVSCERGKWSETLALSTDCDACQELNHCLGGSTCMTGRTSKLCHKW